MSDSMSQAEVQDAESGSVQLLCLKHVSTCGDDHLSEDHFGQSVHGCME